RRATNTIANGHSARVRKKSAIESTGDRARNSVESGRPAQNIIATKKTKNESDVARSGSLSTSTIGGRRRTARGVPTLPPAGIEPLLIEVPREHEDRPQLRDLRRLELQPTEAQPALRTQHLGPKRKDGHEQEQRQGVAEPGERVVHAVVQGGHAPRAHDADGE